MFRRERGVVYGVMNDFDLGQISDVEREGYKGERTGTRPFMSISLHLGEGQTQIPKYIERFDLESVFYVMFWEGRLSNNGELYATKAAWDARRRWNGKDDQSLIQAKKIPFTRLCLVILTNLTDPSSINGWTHSVKCLKMVMKN